jgi:hypothetical protein
MFLSIALLALGACDRPSSAQVSLAAEPGVPAAPGARVPAVAADELQEAAAVSQLHSAPHLNAKVFSLSGGDPAVNGLVTYLALFAGPAEGWRSYPLGDYAEWRVTEARAGVIVLDVRQDTAGPTGDIIEQARTVRVNFTWNGEAPPDEVRVYTAQ